MRFADGDAWTCPDCGNTIRGNPDERAVAQLDHGAEHRQDRAAMEARRRVAAEERAAELEERRRRRHATKLQRTAEARARGGRGAR